MVDFSSEFFPNECYVCHKTRNLKRCSRCQMISYCGFDHQKVHWFVHKDICKVIATLMKERGVTHLFEKLRGCDLKTWTSERHRICQEVGTRIRRSLGVMEQFMFRYSRYCFVCYESRQDLLTNCRGCPSASFCKEHPSSSIHDKDCAKIKECYELTLSTDTKTIAILIAINSIVTGTKVTKSSKLPTSLKEYLFDFAKPKLKILEPVRIFISDMFTMSLTIFSALQKLNFRPVSELNLHIGNTEASIQMSKPWETLLHLLPDLKVLKILFVDYGYVSEEENTSKDPLCPKCRSAEKKLILEFMEPPYGKYIGSKDYKTPDILIYANFDILDEFRDSYPTFKLNLLMWCKLDCPLVLTNFREKEYNLLKENLYSIFGKLEVCFEGYNPFTSLAYIRAWEDGGVGLSNQFMTIIKLRSIPQLQLFNNKFPFEHGRCSSSSSTKKKSLTKKIFSQNCFFASVCHVCHSANSSVTCNRCKMIFYCGKNHLKEHQSQHKDLCKVVLGMLNERGAPNLFDKLTTTDPENWLRTKIDLMAKAKTKLGRKLLDYEEEMFLFPKNCFICHNSDFTVLKNCECGVNLCKSHKDDPEHKKLCSNLSLAFKLTIKGQPQVPKATVKVLTDEEHKSLPSSMEIFIDMHLNLKREAFDINVPNLEKILISDFLTGPLTLLWALEKLNYKVDSSIVLHVVGATNSEISAQKYWKIILHKLPKLKTLKIAFIGPKILNLPPFPITGPEFPSSSLVGKELEVKSHALQYEDYFQSEVFIQSNIIIGFNLGLHESEFGIFECSWEKTIQTLKKVNAPFILTVGSEARARKDHEKLCQVLKETIDPLCCEQNPFAGLIPERDFETERLRFSNQYVIIYNKLESVESNLKLGDSTRCKRETKTNVVPGKSINVKNFDFEEKSTKTVISETESAIAEVSKCKEESTFLQEISSLKEENKYFLKKIQQLKLENKRLREGKQRFNDIERDNIIN